MLAYSVFSLRLSEDVPSQSDSVHLISLYLTGCMFVSLSAMTWFAIANKLREKKRLPHWIRWFALNYLCWVVCAKSMHRKARYAAKSKTTTPKASPLPAMAIPLEPPSRLHPTDGANHCLLERDYLSESSPMKHPLLPSKSIPTSAGAAAAAATHESHIPISQSPSTVWVRRPVTRISSALNGPESSNAKEPPVKSRTAADLTLKNQESLYAIHIINRLFFMIFLFLVIFFNIYTWFIYAWLIETKLKGNSTLWTCYDESKLSVVPCNQTI